LNDFLLTKKTFGFGKNARQKSAAWTNFFWSTKIFPKIQNSLNSTAEAHNFDLTQFDSRMKSL